MKRYNNKIRQKITERRNKEESKRTKVGLLMATSFIVFVILSIQLNA